MRVRRGWGWLLAVLVAVGSLLVTIGMAPASASVRSRAVVRPTAAFGSVAQALPGRTAGDFAYPPDWKSITVPASKVHGWDPINMIIVPKGGTAFTQRDLATALDITGAPWRSVGIGTSLPEAIQGKCVSEQDAKVEPGAAGRAAQDFSWRRVNNGCLDPSLANPLKTTNHARGYYQPSSGAWFLAVSEERACFIPKIVFWHCITPTGYDQGRDHLVTDLTDLTPLPARLGFSVRVAYLQAYAPGEPPQSATNPLGRTPYDGRVAVVTVAKSPSTAPPPSIPTSVTDVMGGGSFAAKWQADGGAGGFLGNPNANWGVLAGGEQQTFSGGAIYWSGGTGTHEVHGAIIGDYRANGGPGGKLGFPTSDEQNAPGGGRENTFAGSSCGSGSAILWTATTRAHEMQGCIYDAYLKRFGGPAGPYGYPVNDEQATKGGGGRVSYTLGTHCGQANEAGLFWSPNTGTWPVGGCIFVKYEQIGEDRSGIGFPTSTEFGTPNGTRQNYSGGYILANANGTFVFYSGSNPGCADYGPFGTGPNSCSGGFSTTSTWFGGGVGLFGKEIWTYANGTTLDSTATYHLHGLDSLHAYKIQAYIPNNHSNATHAHYRLTTPGGGTADDYVNQENFTNTWADVGFVCTSDGTATITLADDGGDKFPLQIGADAVRAVRTGFACSP